MKTAETNLEHRRFDASAFFAHQAAEKALKALYVLKFKRLWRIHDLVELGRRVEAPGEVLKSCDALNPHYIETRYPLDIIYSEEMVKDALENAREVLGWVEEQLRR